MAGKVVTFHPGLLRGSAYVPGDKSISHRALIVGADRRERSRVAHLNPDAMSEATREALNALGTQICTDESDAIVSGSPRARPRLRSTA